MSESSDGGESAGLTGERIAALVQQIRRFASVDLAALPPSVSAQLGPAAVCTNCGHQVTQHDWYDSVSWLCQAPECDCPSFQLDDR